MKADEVQCRTRCGLPGGSMATLSAHMLPPSIAAPKGTKLPEPAGNAAIRVYRAQFPQADLVGLRRRIRATRWPGRESVADASQCVQLRTIEALARHWGSAYDWRRFEATLNRFPQFVTNIDGVDPLA